MPVTKTDLQDALDQALRDGVKHCFGILVEALSESVKPNAAEASGRFKRGMHRHLDAHALASAALSEIVKE